MDIFKAISVVEVAARKDQVKSREVEHVADSLEATASVAVVTQWTTKGHLSPSKGHLGVLFEKTTHPSSRSLHFIRLPRSEEDTEVNSTNLPREAAWMPFPPLLLYIT